MLKGLNPEEFAIWKDLMKQEIIPNKLKAKCLVLCKQNNCTGEETTRHIIKADMKLSAFQKPDKPDDQAIDEVLTLITEKYHHRNCQEHSDAAISNEP